MAKKLEWEIEVEGEVHKVTLDYSMLTGQAIVKIDGYSFDISAGFLKLRGTSQVFRLGESQAILDFPKKGSPDIVFNGVYLHSGKQYN